MPDSHITIAPWSRGYCRRQNAIEQLIETNFFSGSILRQGPMQMLGYAQCNPTTVAIFYLIRRRHWAPFFFQNRCSRLNSINYELTRFFCGIGVLG